MGTLAPGAGWFQLSILGQRATEFFGTDGVKRGFIGGSEFETRSAFVTAAVGVADGMEAWAQLPVHLLRIEGGAGSSASTGVGDVRLALRMSPALVGRDLPVALRVGAKLPGSGFPVDARTLPLTEGQRDWEVSVESAGSLGPLYLVGWIGHRWREANLDTDWDPGNETFAHIALGGSAGPLGWQIAGDGLWARPLTALGFVLPDERRRMLLLLPTVAIDAGPGRLETTAQIPLSGRVLPVGTGLSIGYRIDWGGEPELDPSALEEWLRER